MAVAPKQLILTNSPTLNFKQALCQIIILVLDVSMVGHKSVNLVSILVWKLIEIDKEMIN